MKIAVLSDTRFPTAATFPGHGLGKLNLAIAEGLRARGHDVTLHAGYGSEFSGRLLMSAQEGDFAKSVWLDEYDAILDGGHDHRAARLFPDLPIVNLSHDRESKPGRCAVFPTEAHRAYHRQPGRVVHHGINPDAYPLRTGTGEYLAFLGLMVAHKGPLAAAQVARLSGLPLKLAGPGTPPHGVEHIGALSGTGVIEFLHGARTLLIPAAFESASLTALEAAACGVPVIAFNLGGLPEMVEDGVTGFLVPDIESMAAAVARVESINGAKAREWVTTHRNSCTMVLAYERALEDVARRERW